jgi:hypothetical protein
MKEFIMHLKNILKIKKAQSTVEYVTILLIILGLVAVFLNQIIGQNGALQSYHERMATRVATQ